MGVRNSAHSRKLCKREIEGGSAVHCLCVARVKGKKPSRSSCRKALQKKGDGRKGCSTSRIRSTTKTKKEGHSNP